MSEYSFAQIDGGKFAVWHAVYAGEDANVQYNWADRVGGLSSSKDGIFILHDGHPIGGFTLAERKLSHPFMIPPFDDRASFWNLALEYARSVCGAVEISLNGIPDADADVLARIPGVEMKWTQRRMLRPTEACTAQLDSDFTFTPFTERDIPEVIEVVYEAHSAGYTGSIWGPPGNTEAVISYRYEAFSKTDTRFISTLARHVADGKLAGVCIAGIYPDSSDQFSTIHQVSVRPEYQRRGIARAMMLHSINAASVISPVITLGVLIGNPAEQLYAQLGFAKGPAYSELTYTNR